jgi:hypothetical protein
MKKITRSVIRLSEIPEELQKDKVFSGLKQHTYLEAHIDNEFGASSLTSWLIKTYPTIKRKISFLIHIDK